jgi:hypothetical protein
MSVFFTAAFAFYASQSTPARAAYSPQLCRFLDFGAAAQALGGTIKKRESSVSSAYGSSPAFTTCQVTVGRKGKHTIEFWVDASCFRSGAAAEASLRSNSFFSPSSAEPLPGIGSKAWGMPGANDAYDLFVLGSRASFIVSGRELLRRDPGTVLWISRWLPKKSMVAAGQASLRPSAFCH